MSVVVAGPDAPEFGLLRALQEDGSFVPAMLAEVGAERAKAMYRALRQLRVLDERMLVIQRQGRIGFYGEVKGQEATPIATGFALAPEDWVFPALREGAIMLVRGFPLSTYVAQCFGNSCDVQKGRQMPSHYSGRSVNQVSWSSCIGPQVPQAVGAAWAMKLQRKATIAVGFCGDGATSQPDFHNAMNFAAVYKAPCVLVCQNNHWAISVPSEKQSASPTFASKAVAYGMPGVRVDGNDVVAVWHVLREAAERARSGGGPTFVECVTYRMGAHSSSDDPSRYRAQSEVDAWALKDPVERMRRALTLAGLLTAEEDEAQTAELDGLVRAAITEVESASNPARETLFDDVYAELPWHLREQREALGRAAPAATGHGGH